MLARNLAHREAQFGPLHRAVKCLWQSPGRKRFLLAERGRDGTLSRLLDVMMPDMDEYEVLRCVSLAFAQCT